MIRSSPDFIKSLPPAGFFATHEPPSMPPSASHRRRDLPARLLRLSLCSWLLPALSAVGAQSAPAAGRPVSASVPRQAEQVSGTRELIQAVHAVNRDVVWASGHGAVVLRTVDGGTHWERLRVPDSDSLEFRDVHAVSATRAWILAAGAGAKSRIYHTNDGGATWQLQFRNSDTSAFFDCMTFLDAQRGVAYSDASGGRTLILRTTNGGRTWGLLPAAQVPAPLAGEGAFAASGLCVAGVRPNRFYIAAGAPGARLLTSVDGGVRWTAANTPFVRGPAAGLTGIAFRNARHGMLVAADINRLRTDTSSAVVGVTADAGRTWTMRARPPLPGALAGVAWVPGAGPDAAVVVGFGGAFATNDAGRTWSVLSDAIFTGVDAIGRRAWIAGGGGRIVRLDW